MSATVIAVRRAGESRPREVEQWTPPLNAEALAHLLTRVRDWEPLDWDAVFEDLAAILGDQAPEASEVEELAERLRGSLMRLVTIAVAGHADEKDRNVHVLIERAHTLRSEVLPGDYWQAVGHLRRLAWVTNELLERLSAIKHIKAAT